MANVAYEGGTTSETSNQSAEMNDVRSPGERSEEVGDGLISVCVEV